MIQGISVISMCACVSLFRTNDCRKLTAPRRVSLTVSSLSKLLLIALPVSMGLLAGQATTDPAKTDFAKSDLVNPAPAAGPTAWRDKQIPDWTEEDAKQLLADSPWSHKSPTAVDASADKLPGKDGGHHRAFSIAGLGRRMVTNGGNGSAGNHSSDGGSSDSSSSSSASTAAVPATPPVVSLRWASALPIREAELKSRDVRAPMVDEDHYAIAIYGIPARFVKDDSKKFADRLKTQAALKRRAKQDLVPSGVEIILRDDGPVVLYFFPRTMEITWRDHQIDFEAEVGALKIKQIFETDDMKFHGKLEL